MLGGCQGRSGIGPERAQRSGPGKAVSNFPGKRGRPKRRKVRAVAPVFFWDNFWDNFWEDFWAMLRGPVGDLGLEPVAALFKGGMWRLLRWLYASEVLGGSPWKAQQGAS